MYTRLKYTGLGSITISTSAFAAGVRYRPTAAYDIDPTIASTATPGFSEWSGFYGTYRVTSSRCRVRFVNTSNLSGVVVVIVPLNADPGPTPLSATINSWLDQPYTEYKMVGTAGSPAATVVSEMSTEKIFGSKQVYFDDNFNSLVTGVPINNWYWCIGAIAPVIPTTAIVVSIIFEIDIGVEFFNRKLLIA